MSFRLAEEIQKNIPEFEEVVVWMYNVIGKPVNQPAAVVVQPITVPGSKITKYETKIKEIVNDSFQNIDKLCLDLIEGKIKIA